jgi:hypothetical protein
MIHLFMLLACGLLFGISSGFHAAAYIALACIAAVPAILWHDKRQFDRRDAALTLPWAVLVAGLIPRVTVHSLAYSMKLGIPFRDASYVQLDRALGINVPAVIAWFAHFPRIVATLNFSYWLLDLFLLAAVLVPALSGQKKRAQQLLVANLLLFMFTIPIFTFAPAIGPWAGFHFAGSAVQQRVGREMLALQTASICFPSYHAIWAVFSAWALWFIKPLRIPLATLATLIVISTVTTGWHYAIDPIAGVPLALASLACADVFLKSIAGDRFRKEVLVGGQHADAQAA